MTVKIRELVEPFSESELEDAVDVCVKAYNIHDTGVQALLGGDLGLWPILLRASVRAAAIGGKIYLAMDDLNSQTVGMALWWGPGQAPFADEQQRQVGFYEFWNNLSPEGKDFHQYEYSTVFNALADEALGPGGKLKSWWLNYIAVGPSYHRRGIASALISAVRVNASGADLGVAAVNPTNVQVYQKIGFQERAKTEMSSPWGSFWVYVFSIKSGTSDP